MSEKIDSAYKLLDLIKDDKVLFPKQLTKNFPHIISKIVALWPEPQKTHMYFEELLTSHRENRAGFPLEVYQEIFELHNYYVAHHVEEIKKDNYWGTVDAMLLEKTEITLATNQKNDE